MTDEQIATRDRNAHAYADGLRQIADFIDANPDFPLPYERLMKYSYDREEFLAGVKVLTRGGKVQKEADDIDMGLASYRALRQFGAVTLGLQIDRKQVCRLVRPAVYDCPDSLLEAGAEYEAAK